MNARVPNTPNTQAAQLLQTAINLNAARPEAYQLMGIIELYGNHNFDEARRYMTAAIERGGDAVFRVYHDHANGSFNTYCIGSLYVSKNKVTYEADNGVDSYRANFAEIKEAKVNGLLGKNLGAFHIKINQGRNYNFAPATKNVTESQMIVGFISSK